MKTYSQNKQLTPEFREELTEFARGRFLAVEKSLLEQIGGIEALFICNLIDKWIHFSDKGQLVDGMFYRTTAQQCRETGLPERALLRAKRYFVQRGIVNVQRAGLPAKEYYTINIDALKDHLTNKALIQSSIRADGLQDAETNPPKTARDSFRNTNNQNAESRVGYSVETCSSRGVETLRENVYRETGLNTYVFRDDVSRRAADEGEPDGVSEELYNRRKVVDAKVSAKINRKGNLNRKRNGSIHAAKTRKGSQSKLYNNRKGNPPSAETPPDGPDQDWSEADGIIQAWNALPGVARTRIADQPTQTLTRCRTLLTNLLRGKPLTHRVEKGSAKLERFLDRCEAGESLHRAKWSAQQIMAVLQTIPGHKLAGDKPALEAVLWNGFSKGQKNQGFSLFLWIASARQADQPYRDRAERLAEVVQGISDAKVTDRQIEAWAGDIRTLHKDHEVGLSRVDTLLAWYNTHSGDDYVPVVMSGRDLLNKFTKLEAAQKRDAKPAEQPRRTRGMRVSPDQWKRAGTA